MELSFYMRFKPAKRWVIAALTVPSRLAPSRAMCCLRSGLTGQHTAAFHLRACDLVTIRSAVSETMPERSDEQVCEVERVSREVLMRAHGSHWSAGGRRLGLMLLGAAAMWLCAAPAHAGSVTLPALVS